MRLSDFDYELPKGLIAQQALPKRTDARLLILDRAQQTMEHKKFSQILEHFHAGDVLVLNDTKVLPARLFAKRKTGGRVEVLMLGYHNRHCKERDSSRVIASLPATNLGGRAKQSRALGTGSAISEIASASFEALPRNDGVHEVLLKPSRRVCKGEELVLDGESGVSIHVLDDADHKTGIRHVQFYTRVGAGFSATKRGACLPDRQGSAAMFGGKPAPTVEQILDRIGRIPLPPYIDREDLPIDRELYQTVFAKNPGAVASPTAGLHFDEPLLNAIKKKGVEIAFVTLHVGYGTFQPVQSDDLSRHQMYEEYFEISEEMAETVSRAKSEGKRVIACGTTVVRTLETAAFNILSSPKSFIGEPSSLDSRSFDRLRMVSEVEPLGHSGMTQNIFGRTNLFIYPPYEFKIVDAMITNFHLPRTTLLMLTSAFAGHEFLMRAYREAIQNRYRFYSYGDAMLIV